jgi:hypothetical protein
MAVERGEVMEFGGGGWYSHKLVPSDFEVQQNNMFWPLHEDSQAEVVPDVTLARSKLDSFGGGEGGPGRLSVERDF